jgi:O-antigen/teichoic acid export membrane protein
VLYVVSLSQVRGAFYPVIAATLPPLLVKGDRAVTNEFIQRQTRWVALLAMPLCVLFAGFGDGLLAVFGGEFLRAAPALAILSIGHLSGALAVPAYALLLGGKARYSTIAAVSCLLFQLVALPILVPRYGLIGAAISSAAGMLLSQVVQLGFAWRIEGVHGFSLDLGKVAIAAAAGFACGRALFQWMPAPLVARFFVGVAVAAVVYAAVLASLGLRDDEREVVASTWQKLRGRLARGRKR